MLNLNDAFKHYIISSLAKTTVSSAAEKHLITGDCVQTNALDYSNRG